MSFTIKILQRFETVNFVIVAGAKVEAGRCGGR